MKIYTKRGDSGQTDLIGGTRASKDDIRLEAYGTADELNSFIGLLRSKINDLQTDNILDSIQNKLFNIGAYLATDQSKIEIGDWAQITENDLTTIENEIDRIEPTLPQLKQFILPCGNETTALAHICRTITRRFERILVKFNTLYTIDSLILKYVNRLSDYFFILAKKTIVESNDKFIFWKK